MIKKFLLPTITLAFLVLGGCWNSGSPVENARNDLRNVKKSAAENIKQAEDKLAKVILETEQRIKEARTDLAKSPSAPSGDTVSGATASASEEVPELKIGYCKGLEIGGITESEADAYRQCQGEPPQ
jgi:hypothetical protein